MAALAADRNLLFGLLALQNGLIDQVQLVAAFQAWTRDRARPLAEHLAARGDLDDEQRAGIEAMVALHLKKHGGDVEKSLAAVPAARTARASLALLGDPDIEGTLGRVASAHGVTQADDPDRTAGYSHDATAANGQRFRVLRPHARGGLGAVFVALDSELNREVALKQILDRHADDPVSRQRFLLEAEVTGRLEHPGIVPVYGLGSYPDGRPYYAMRFVKGESLKEAIDRFQADEALTEGPGRRSLELRKLLRRFTDVCNAIDYAHSRGVLHRDLKPANIVLGKHGETLVVDWGLARARGHADPGAEERTLVPSASGGSSETMPGSALGTPAYMSPEQARGDLDRLGPRSDVYSLGATLSCLLTGKPPLEGDDVGEMLRRVQSGEIPTPRQVDPSIDPALEAVCLKAMATEPKDRYATAHALAEDVERWMADEPVSAWREPASRRALRWLTRHRTGVTAAGVALLVALAGTAAVLAVQASANVGLRRANRELAVANGRVTKTNADLETANERERQRFDLAMEAIKLFHGEVSEDLLLKEKQFQGLRSKLLKSAADFYGKMERRLEGQTDLPSRAALGRAYFELGNLTRDIGNTAEALAVHRKGLAVRRELAGRPGSDDAAVLDVVRSLSAVEGCLQLTGDYAGSVAPQEEALRLAEGLVAAGRGADEARFALADCLGSMADRLAKQRPQDGLEAARRALAIVREVVGKHPPVGDVGERLGGCHFGIGFVLAEMGKPEARTAFEEAVAIFQKLAAARPDVYRLQDLLARLHNNIASTYWGHGQQDASFASMRRALAIWRKAAEAYPTVSGVANNLAFGLNGIADNLIDVGRPAEALEALAEARPILRKLVATGNVAEAPISNLAWTYTVTGTALARMGRWREAEEAFEEAVSIYRNLDKQLSNKGYQLWEPYGLSRFGWTLWKAGRAAEAASAFGRERAIRQRFATARPAGAAARRSLAVCESNGAAALLSLGRLAEARACCDRAIAIGEGLLQGDPEGGETARLLAVSLLRSGSVRATSGDPAGAAADWRRAAALYASHPPLEPKAAITQACCYGALAGLAGREGSGISAVEAAAQAEEAMAILRRATAGGYRDPDLLRVEPGLDPLRSRTDFGDLMLDQTFPSEPFATER